MEILCIILEDSARKFSEEGKKFKKINGISDKRSAKAFADIIDKSCGRDLIAILTEKSLK